MILPITVGILSGMTPHEFIAKWKPAELKERAACQEHFLDLCRLLGQKSPADADPKGEWYAFEKGVQKDIGGQGFADVWRKDCFGWEYYEVANLQCADLSLGFGIFAPFLHFISTLSSPISFHVPLIGHFSPVWAPIRMAMSS